MKRVLFVLGASLILGGCAPEDDTDPMTCVEIVNGVAQCDPQTAQACAAVGDLCFAYAGGLTPVPFCQCVAPAPTTPLECGQGIFQGDAAYSGCCLALVSAKWCSLTALPYQCTSIPQFADSYGCTAAMPGAPAGTLCCP